MKIRNSFVTNSSSSSFIISSNEYHPKTNIEHIKEVLKDIITLYEKHSGLSIMNDYKIFESSDIKGITDRLHNECWSASGIKLPDDIHEMFCSLRYYNRKMRPKEEDFKKAIQELIAQYGEEKVKDIVNYEKITFGEDGISNEEEFAYYDEEFQKALRGDFVIITGENIFPYSIRELIEDLLNAEYNHLG